jgi:rSAM/selenodomain-associated transferase 1
MDRCLLLFSKPARPGRVKTRLIGDLSAEQAAELSAAFLADAIAELTAGRYDLKLAWALEEGEEPPPSDLPVVRQKGGDLGERLHAALSEAARRYPRVAAVGSDHPTLSRREVEAAFELLEGGAEVVLGPADDGGYYLIAIGRAQLSAELFSGIPWSSSEVLASTLERCRLLGLSVRLLPGGRDVDTPSDLAALTSRLALGGSGCPRTRALLARWGRLPAACP